MVNSTFVEEGAKTDTVISSGKEKKRWKRRKNQAMNSEFCGLEIPIFRASGMQNSCKEPILEWIEKQKNKFPF